MNWLIKTGEASPGTATKCPHSVDITAELDVIHLRFN